MPAHFRSALSSKETLWLPTLIRRPAEYATQSRRPRRATPEPGHAAEDQRTILLNEIAWGAVLAGVVVALVTQLLLNMLGLG